jgi:hypothetical protein
VSFTGDETYTKIYSSQGQAAQVNVIKVPKSAIGFVTVGKFNTTEKVTHMPMVSFTLGAVFVMLSLSSLSLTCFLLPASRTQDNPIESKSADCYPSEVQVVESS